MASEDTPEFPIAQSSIPKSWWRDPYFFVLCALPIPFWIIWHSMGFEVYRSVWLLVLIAPILEEIVFRGALQGWLINKTQGRRLLGPISWANALTSIAFASLHGLKQGGALAWLTFFPSLLFGLCRERYRTLTPGILLHAYYNAGLWL
jgi:membrane protease YdiL (CAAX protease family)